MARLEGSISISDLPPHRGLIVHIAFFSVSSLNTPPPYNGDPPTEAVLDADKLFERVDLNSESHNTNFEHHFYVERPAGFYYVQLRMLLFRNKNGGMFAQAEQFFFARRPVLIAEHSEGQIAFPVSWPSQPLEKLHHYGTVVPRAKRPWWRFWE